MPQNWKTYQFEELYAQPSRNGLNKPKRVRGEGVKMVNMGELFAYSFIGSQEMDRVPVTDGELNSSLLEEGDLLFARQSLVESGVGKCALILGLSEPTVFESHIIRVRPNQSISNSAFLYYLFQSAPIRHQIMSLANGVAAFGIKGSDLSAMKMVLPPLPEQKSIASILSALDNKIENNLAMNKTLEEMAMALYKHWFVDFGPFQDGEFVPSELGDIPKGWEVKRLDQILEVKRGGSPRPIQKFLSVKGLHWLKISDATASNSPFLYTTKEFIVPEGLKKTIKVGPGSIILSNSATPGLPRLIEFDTCIHDGWLHFPKIERFNRYILYLLFLDIKEHLIQQGNGSVFTNLKTDILKSQLIKLPTIEVEDSFTRQITPWFEQIKANTEETHSLTQLRDTLLPKLISGEVRVKDAEQTVANAL